MVGLRRGGFSKHMLFFYLGGYDIPGPVSCRCPSGSLETPPRWHATISIYGMQSPNTNLNWINVPSY